MQLMSGGEPAVIMAFQWDWWNVVFIVIVIVLAFGAFYFGRGEGGH